MPVSENDLNEITKASALLKECQNILFITGAGLSADSGLPTYRGIGGLYNNGITEDGISIEEAISGPMLNSRPDIAWKYLGRIEATCRDAQFNRAHAVIALMEDRFERVWILTQNVDGFHRDAGSKNIIDIHGDLHDLACTQCQYRHTVRDYSGLQIPPQCPDCGALVRPEVVLFGETLPMEKLLVLEKELRTGFDMVISIGTTSVFPYIAQPVMNAVRMGLPVVEINPGETRVSDFVSIKIRAGAADTMERIWVQLTL